MHITEASQSVTESQLSDEEVAQVKMALLDLFMDANHQTLVNVFKNVTKNPKMARSFLKRAKKGIDIPVRKGSKGMEE